MSEFYDTDSEFAKITARLEKDAKRKSQTAIQIYKNCKDRYQTTSALLFSLEVKLQKLQEEIKNLKRKQLEREKFLKKFEESETA